MKSINNKRALAAIVDAKITFELIKYSKSVIQSVIDYKNDLVS